jgi:hypothetical protein
MLNGTVEPLLTMTSSTNRFMPMIMSNNERNIHSNGTSSKRSSMKASSRRANASTNSNHSTVNNDNRIKFIDMLVCGSCQQDFQLSDIVKFIEHKAICGNKENKMKMPYFQSQRRARQDDDDDYDDDDDGDDDDDNDNNDYGGNGNQDSKSRPEDHSSASETENHLHLHQQHSQSYSHQANASQKHSAFSKVLVDASANTLNSTSNVSCLI